MNRAQKTRKYLEGQYQLFEGYASYRDSRDAFFSAVAEFRVVTLRRLRRTRLFADRDLNSLDSTLAKIDVMKTKGHDNRVYWSSVGPEYDEAKRILNKFILRMDETKIRFWMRLEDFLKDVFAERSAKYVILSVAAIIVAGFLSGFFKLLIHELRFLFLVLLILML